MICKECRNPIRPYEYERTLTGILTSSVCECGMTIYESIPIYPNRVLNAVRRPHPADFDVRCADSANDADSWWLWPVLVVSMGLLVIGACHRIIGG